MDLSWDQQRLDSSYRLLTNELKTSKDDLNSLKHEFNNVVDENRRLRQELKEVLAEKLKPIGGSRGGGDNIDKDIINNLEGQINLLKKERDNAVGVWQNSLQVISQLEQELKLLQFKTAPDTMSFEFELKKRQEEFARKEANFERELAVLRIESNKKEEDIMDARLKQNELRLQIENLRAQLNQKDQDRRNMIRKEFGYDDALISLQNDISELETRAMSLSKENQYLRDSLQEAQVKNVQIAKNSAELERLNVEYKNQHEESLRMVERFKEEKRKADLELLSQREEHEKLHNAIGELMDEAATRARQEIESLRKIYNTNLEKLIEECSSLEADRNSLAVNLERAIRAKKSIEQEIEKLTTDHLRISTKDNSNYEEAHRRMCVAEREKEQALSRLEAKETEIKKLQSMLDTEKSKNYQIVNELSEKSHKSVRDLERLAEENSKLVNELDEIKKKISSIETDRDNAQKKLTKQIQIHENEMKIKAADFLTKTKTLEDNHSRAMFDLRQLLNMQQRMSNKWKEECHVITSQSEAKFNEMKKNFENLRAHNEKLAQDVQELRRREVENERINDSYLNKVKTLEARVKDAELQAAEATKRMAKQLAKEKLITYEKHLLESDLERSKFVDTFSKGKVFLKNLDANEIPVKPNHADDE